jgi:anaerobic selenocysteine-containing dehydrogenase
VGGKPTGRFQAAVGKSRYVPIGRIGAIVASPLLEAVRDWDAFEANYDRIREKIEAVFPKLFPDFNARIRIPGGFHLYNGPRNREWHTSTGRANFLVCAGVAEDPDVGDPAALQLTTIRSHDQYNTTIYGLDDRYRGVFGGRMVVFMNKDDMADRQIEPD